MLDWIRGQLEELHDDLNGRLLSGVAKKSIDDLKVTKLDYNKNRKVICTVSVTNIGRETPEYVVDELNRLKSAILSMKSTIDIMKQTAYRDEEDG